MGIVNSDSGTLVSVSFCESLNRSASGCPSSSRSTRYNDPASLVVMRRAWERMRVSSESRSRSVVSATPTRVSSASSRCRSRSCTRTARYATSEAACRNAPRSCADTRPGAALPGRNPESSSVGKSDGGSASPGSPTPMSAARSAQSRIGRRSPSSVWRSARSTSTTVGRDASSAAAAGNEGTRRISRSSAERPEGRCGIARPSAAMRSGFRSRSAVLVSSCVRPSDRQRHALRGCDYVRRAASLAHQRLALVHALIDLIVRALRLVVKEHQAFHVRIERQGDHIVIRRVAPAAMMIVFLACVHRIVHEHAGVAHEAHEILTPMGWRIVLLRCAQLVIRDVDERRPTPVSVGEAISHRAAGVANLRGAHRVAATLQGVVQYRTKVDAGGYFLKRHGEDDGRHLITDDTLDTGLGGLGPPNGEVVAQLEDGGEERQTLNVVPMTVREENVALDWRSIRTVDQRAAELPDPGAGVEDDQPPFARAHLHARRVAPIAHGL